MVALGRERGTIRDNMDIVEKLFGSAARVRILRLFLFNEGANFENADIAKQTKTNATAVRRETALFLRIGLIKRVTFSVPVTYKKGSKKRVVKKRVQGWSLDSKCPQIAALRSFLLTAAPMEENQIIKKLNRAGRCKLVVVAGSFIQDWDGAIDLLIVGDGINDTRLERAVRDIEVEIGKELRYALFTTRDFQYRMNIYDRLLRDIFDYPHQTLLNRLGSQYEGTLFSKNTHIASS